MTDTPQVPEEIVQTALNEFYGQPHRPWDSGALGAMGRALEAVAPALMALGAAEIRAAVEAVCAEMETRPRYPGTMPGVRLHEGQRWAKQIRAEITDKTFVELNFCRAEPPDEFQIVREARVNWLRDFIATLLGKKS